MDTDAVARCHDCGITMEDAFALEDPRLREIYWHVDLRKCDDGRMRCRRCREDYPFDQEADSDG